jgi:excisionase family DNA binding protein
MEHDTILTTEEAARYLKVSKRYLEKLRTTGGGPVFLKADRIVRYRRRDLEEYLESLQARSTSQVAARNR